MADWEDHAEKMIEDVRPHIQVGCKLLEWPKFPKSNPNRRLSHVRALVDDYQIVTRSWRKRKQCWYYKVESLYWYGMLYEKGDLKITPPKKAKKKA